MVGKLNILTEQLPTSLIVEGKEYPIRYDFRTWIKVSELLSGGRKFKENFVALCKLIFDFKKLDGFPETITALTDAVVRFYSCGGAISSAKEEKGKSEPHAAARDTFSFKYDAGYIYAAFLQAYGIDLAKSDMHWFLFSALLGALPEDTKLVKIIGYRGACLSDYSGKQRAFYAEMKQKYALPDTRSPEEKDRDMMSALSAVF